MERKEYPLNSMAARHIIWKWASVVDDVRGRLHTKGGVAQLGGGSADLHGDA